MNKPKVSICIPTFNRADYLKIALVSALNQTYENIEIIVSDNCSADGTNKIFENINNNKIVYYRFKKSVSAIENWNNCVKISSGEYITFLCDDDVLEKKYVEILLKLITTDRHISLVHCGANIIDKDGKKIGYFHQLLPRIESSRDFIFYHIVGRRLSGLPGYLFKKSDFFAVGGCIDVGFDGLLYTDSYFWFCLALKGKYVVSTQERLWNYRKHTGHMGYNINLSKFRNNIPNYINLVYNLTKEYELDGRLIKFLKDIYPKKLLVDRLQFEAKRSREHSLYEYFKFLILNCPLILLGVKKKVSYHWKLKQYQEKIKKI